MPRFARLPELIRDNHDDHQLHHVGAHHCDPHERQVDAMDELIKEQQRRVDELITSRFRLDTAIELAPHRSALPMQLLAKYGRDAGPER